MLEDLDTLAAKVAELVKMVLSLRADNQSLRGRVAEAAAELDTMRARVEEASRRIDLVVAHLPAASAAAPDS